MPRFEKWHVILLCANVVLVLVFLLTQAFSQPPLQDTIRAKVVGLDRPREQFRTGTRIQIDLAQTVAQ